MTAARDVIVIGGGGHCKVVVRTLQALGHRVVGILDDNPQLWGTTQLDIPIPGPTTSWQDYQQYPAAMAVGDNADRRRLVEQIDLEWLSVVHPSAAVDGSAVLGTGALLFAGAVVQPDAHVGSHTIVNTAASVDHDGCVGDFAHVGPGVHLAADVAVDEGAFLGVGASVIRGVRVGVWSVVGAGAAVIDDVPDHTVAVGVPAKTIKDLPTADLAADCNGTSPLSETLAEAAAKEQAVDAQERIYLSPPHMSPRERELLLDAFDSNWIAPLGPHVDQFEREFAAKVGTNEAVALSSGTAALHLALLLLGVEQGDEVITSTLTFAATANAIAYVGATPVFIDSDAQSWNMDPELLGDELEACAKRGKLPKAVIAVDLYGQCADYDRIRKLCQFYDVPLVEDAAEALGATYGGRAAGTFGALGVFSFNGNKILTSGGGMLTTDRTDWAERARFLATQARDPAPHYQHSEVGYNYRMSNLLAAVGRGQLANLATRVEQRRANFAYYRQALADLPGIRFMPEFPGGRSTRWLSCILIDPTEFGAAAEEVRQLHEARNIESRPLWKPMHQQPVFAGCRIRGSAIADNLFQHGLCLPSGSNLTEGDRHRVVDAIRGACRAGAPSMSASSPASDAATVD